MKENTDLPILQPQYLNTANNPVNTQVRLGGNSGIVWNYRKRRVFANLPSDDGILCRLAYPRVKKLSNGDLFMVLQEGQVSESVYTMRSTDDGQTWENPKAICARYFDPELNDYICYATGEVLELANGELLFACSVRGREGYRQNRGDGIDVRISKDFGHTWSEPVRAYEGANWEPQMIRLPSGEIQMFFTQQAPYFAEGLLNSVDIGLVRSFDNGRTWTGKLPGEPWRVQALSRLHQLDGDGKEFSDGMPVAVYLNEDKGIVYACESLRTEEKVSIVCSSVEKNWDYPEFTIQSVGPDAPRRWNAIGEGKGYAPYLIQLPSGETVLCYNTVNSVSGSLQVGLGDAEAKNFSGFETPFPNEYGAYWGSLFAKNPHTVMATAMACAKDGSDLKVILYTEGQLNHTMVAQKQTAPVDGSASGWLDDSVLFVGSRSQAQATIRVAYDEENLYLLAQRLDKNILFKPEEGKVDALDILLSLNGPQIRKIRVTAEGFASCDLPGALCRTQIHGTVNDDTDEDLGFVNEVKIPWSALGGMPGKRKLAISAVLEEASADGVILDPMTAEPVEQWYTVILGEGDQT